MAGVTLMLKSKDDVMVFHNVTQISWRHERIVVRYIHNNEFFIKRVALDKFETMHFEKQETFT